MTRLIVLLVMGLFQTTISLAQEVQQKLKLDEFLALVERENLDLKIDQSKTDVAEAKSAGLALPAPMIGVSQMKEQDGLTARGFEVNQMIPFPTKITSDRSARKYEAQAQKEIQNAGRNEVLSSAKLLFISLWADQERLSLFKEKSKILQDHVKLSRSAVRSDSFAAVHLLKTESDRDLLENEIVAAEQHVKERQLQIASFLNADPGKFQYIAENPPLSAIPESVATTQIPQLRSLELSLEGMRSKERQAVSGWFPDLSIRYKQMGATSMAGPYNEVMMGVTLPFVFFWEPASEVKSARLERSQKEYELEKERRLISSKKETLLSRVSALRQQVENLNGKLIPRAEKRMKIIHNVAPRDMETLQDHRETMEALPDLKMKALDLRLEYEEAIAELAKFLGKVERHE